MSRVPTLSERIRQILAGETDRDHTLPASTVAQRLSSRNVKSISAALSKLYLHENYGQIHRRKVKLRAKQKPAMVYWFEDQRAQPKAAVPELPDLPDFLMVTDKGEPHHTIPMILFCPSGHRHIDEGNFATHPHHTHACQECGIVWRPAKVNTHGVQFLPGYKNGD